MSVYLYDALKYNLFKEIESELAKKIAITRAHMDIEDFENKNSPMLKVYADEIKRNTMLRTTMIDKIGYVLADSDVPLAELDSVENHLFRKEVQDALRSGRGMAIRTSATINKRLLYYCETVKKQGRVIGFIRLAMFAPELDARIDFIWDIIWKISILFVFSVAIAATVLTLLYNRSQKSIARDLISQRQKKKFKPLSDEGREEFHPIITALNQYSYKLHQKVYKTKEKQKRLGFLYDFFNEGIALFDDNDQVLFFNKAFLNILKIKQDSAFDEPFYYWLHFPPLVQDIEHIQKNQEIIKRSIKYYGDTYIEYELLPVKESDELTGNIILRIRDITQIQKLEEIRQAFITNASHELNTPLSSINGYLETLLSGTVKDKKKQTEFLEKIQKQASLLINLVRDLNDLAKSDTEMIDSKTYFELKPFLIKIMKKYNTKLKSTGIELSNNFDCLADDLTVFSYQNYLQKIISNLLDNAIQYNKKAGKIFARVELKDKMIHVEVEDTGIGIRESEKDRIFELLYRTEDAREIYSEGTGMGLTIVYNFVQRMDGKLGLKSNSGEGTIIWFEFPIE
ncbi:MAG: hypothetical protein JW956_10950 [Calditrichaceae bacterium]|nr:hypothetical protein [Calditrichaceae bacterium]